MPGRDGAAASAADLAKALRESVGRVFIGYKGGEFIMRGDTSVYFGDYGDCGPMIVGVRDGEAEGNASVELLLCDEVF